MESSLEPTKPAGSTTLKPKQLNNRYRYRGALLSAVEGSCGFHCPVISLTWC